MIPIGCAAAPARGDRRRRRRAVKNLPVIDLNIPRTRQTALTLPGSRSRTSESSARRLQGDLGARLDAVCGQACHSVMDPSSPPTAARRTRGPLRGPRPAPTVFVKSSSPARAGRVGQSQPLPRPIRRRSHNLRPRARPGAVPLAEKSSATGCACVPTRRDEANPKEDVLCQGWRTQARGRARLDLAGIHWHIDPEHQIRYLSDESRETI